MFEITDSPIRIDALTEAVSDSTAGAIATFIGTTRDHNRGRIALRMLRVLDEPNGSVLGARELRGIWPGESAWPEPGRG